MNGWPTRTLGDICREGGGFIRTGPFGSQLHQSDYTDDADGIPVVMPKDMARGRIDRSSVARIDEATARRLPQHLLSADDVVLSRRGDVGRSAWVYEDDLPAFCGTGSMRIHLGSPSDVRREYLRFFLHTKQASDYLKAHAVGATMPNLNAGIVERLPVPIPPIAAQNGMIKVLEAFDALIENNKRRGTILDEMAWATYREWFMKFRYPGHEEVPLVESALGPIPDGWAIATLGAVCCRVQAGSTPSRSEPSFWSDPDFDWYKTGDLADSVLVRSSERISRIAFDGGRRFDPDTILLAIYGSPTVGRLGLVTTASSANQAALGLVANSSLVSTEFLWFTLRGLRVYLNQIAQGAAQQNVSKEKVAKSTFVLPDRSLVERFTDGAGQIWRQANTIARSSAHLADLRDLLLPKLMTGQIDASTLDLGAVLNGAVV